MAMADPCGASMEGSGADVEEGELGAVAAAAVQIRDLVAAATGGELRAGRSTRYSSGSAGLKAMEAAVRGRAEAIGRGGGGTG